MRADGLQGRTSELRWPGTDAGGYHDLRQVVTAAGLLERAPGHYVGLGGICLALLVVAVAAPFLIAPALVGNVLSAALFAMAIVQAALLGHDAGHLAVFRRQSSNRDLGQLCWSLV